MPNVTSGGFVEMGADKQHIGVGQTFQRFDARRRCLAVIEIRNTEPILFYDLHRMVQKVSADEGLISSRTDANTHVPRGMTGRRFEPYVVGNLMICLHKLSETRCDHRL